MRKESYVTITAEGRDKGRTYFLREMPASQVEDWAARAIVALQNSGADLPAGVGMAGVVAVGFDRLQKLDYRDIKPLMDEMMTCIHACPHQTDRTKNQRALIEDDIEEVATRIFLKAEVFKLHTGFSVADLLSKVISVRQSPASSNTKTRRKSSPRSSRPAKRR